MGYRDDIAAIALVVMMAIKANFFSARRGDVGYALPGSLFVASLAINAKTLLSLALAPPAGILLGKFSYALCLTHFPAVRLHLPVTNDLAAYFLVTMLFTALSIGLLALGRPARQPIRHSSSPRKSSGVISATYRR